MPCWSLSDHVSLPRRHDSPAHDLTPAMMPLPPVARIRQATRHPALNDPAGELARVLRASRLSERLPRGASVALTVGSRGIHGLPQLVTAAVTTLKEMGFAPFVVAAMGSHGGGTAEGQRALLAQLGVTESTIGCPIRAEMETLELGRNRFGLPIHFDRHAYNADGIIVFNRIKPHTSFTGTHESGLLKMLAVGLGKRQGAAQVHQLGLPGLKVLIPEVGAFLIEHAPVALGVAVLENADDRVAQIVALEPEAIVAQEPALLERAREMMARLPFDQLDVLIVGELGKNYSGTGMDPNVIGRQRVETMPDLPRPVITRIVTLGLSVETHGNALGVGLADLITRRLAEAIDPTPMRVNSLTTNFLTRARVPIDLPTDRDAIQAGLDTCWKLDPAEVRLALIPNTLELSTLWISPALADDADRLPGLSRETDFTPLPWTSADPDRLDLARLFPESLIARRKT